MSTNARIGIELLNEVESIYTHWDGYTEHHGPILLDHYSTREAVLKLIALGDLSTLGETVGQKHDFDARYDDPTSGNWCKAFGRDRGETETEATRHGFNDWPDSGQSYEYLFTRDGWKWRESECVDKPDGRYDIVWGKWQPLMPVEVTA